MTKKTTTPSKQNTRREEHAEEQALDRRYGEIGIPAVAAALKFKRESKNPTDVPMAPEMDEDRIAEMAA